MSETITLSLNPEKNKFIKNRSSKKPMPVKSFKDEKPKEKKSGIPIFSKSQAISHHKEENQEESSSLQKIENISGIESEISGFGEIEEEDIENEEFEDNEDNDNNEDSNSISNYNTESYCMYKNKHCDTKIENRINNFQNLEKENDKKESSMKMVEEIEEEEYSEDEAQNQENNLSKLLSQFISQEDFNNSMNSLPKTMKSFLEYVSPLSNYQKNLWYHRIINKLNENGISFSQEISYINDLSNIANRFYKAHRLTTETSSSFRFQGFISGPPSSGKSTFLATFVEQLMVQLLVNETWKSSFIFGLDLAILGGQLHDFAYIFNVFSKAAIMALSAHQPLLIPFEAGLIKTFSNITRGSFQLPSNFLHSNAFKKEAIQLQKLLHKYFVMWNDKNAAYEWFLNSVSLPQKLAKIFGFKKIYLFFDHFDVFNSSFLPGFPFEESKNYIYPQEPLKFSIASSNFLLSYKNSENFFHAMEASDDDGIDLSFNLESISTLDVVENPPHSTREYLVYISQHHQKIPLNINFFGGSPAYLEKWEELNQVADSYFKDKNEDTKMEMCAIFQMIMNDILYLQKDITVTNVTLKSE